MSMVLAMLPTLAQSSLHGEQESIVYNPSGIINANAQFFTDNQQGCINNQKEIGNSSSKTEMDTYSITLFLDYDANEFHAPWQAYILSKDAYSILHDYTFSGTMRGQVTPGIYDIVATFSKGFSQYSVIKEQIEINSDTSFVLCPNECTNHIEFKNSNPNGQLFKLGLGHMNEMTGNWIHDDDGNIDNMLVKTQLIIKGIYALSNTLFGFYGDMDSEDMRYIPVDFYVNDVSNRVLITRTDIAISYDGYNDILYCNYFSTDDVTIGEISNDPTEYLYYNDNCKYSPYGRSKDGYGQETMILTCLDGRYNGLLSVSDYRHLPKQGDTYSCETWINIPGVDTHYPDLEVFSQTNYADYFSKVIDPSSGQESVQVEGWIMGPQITVKDKKIYRTNLGHHQKYGDTYLPNTLYNSLSTLMGNPSFFCMMLPSPEALTYDNSRALTPIGDNCPINAVKALSFEAYGQIYYEIQDYLVGRNNEVIWSKQGKTSRLKINGQEVDTDSFTPDNKSIYEWTSVYTNIEVDGLSGHNTTTIYFDQNKEDMTPPSIEMLQFKNRNGDITDCFATAADGTMEFYASDFHYQHNPEMWNGLFECQPVEVTVEYAPYGTEEWNELSVEEIPEYYQEPGWGYFFRAPLADVEGTAEKGWFDLRFRLQDASGNWMDQVVSPAFRIDNLAYSSVANVGSDNAREVARYNLAGQRVDSNHRGVTIVKMSDGTAKKIVQ